MYLMEGVGLKKKKNINGCRVHVFKCSAPNCKGKTNSQKVHCYLDTTDAKSISNLCKHAKVCWGEEPVAAADTTKDVHAAREALGKYKDSSITAAFQRVAKSKVTYSYCQHTMVEAWYVFFSIVNWTIVDAFDRAEIV